LVPIASQRHRYIMLLNFPGKASSTSTGKLGGPGLGRGLKVKRHERSRD
jgi:hypothetical protein